MQTLPKYLHRRIKSNLKNEIAVKIFIKLFKYSHYCKRYIPLSKQQKSIHFEHREQYYGD